MMGLTKRKHRRNRAKGFTLVELLIVMLIISILAVAIVPSIKGYIKDARNASNLSKARAYYSIIQTIVDDLSYSNAKVQVYMIQAPNFGGPNWTELTRELGSAELQQTHHALNTTRTLPFLEVKLGTGDASGEIESMIYCLPKTKDDTIIIKGSEITFVPYNTYEKHITQ